MNIGWYAFGFAVILTAVLFLTFTYANKNSGKGGIENLLNRFGFTRKIYEKISSARFASVMSMMISSGYSTEDALKLIPKIVQSKIMRAKVGRCATEVEKGVSLAECIEKERIFPGLYGRMVGIGQRTGNLDSVMGKLADIYDAEAHQSINKVIGFIEPAMVAVLSVVIGAILLSVMLPLMAIMSSIG